MTIAVFVIRMTGAVLPQMRAVEGRRARGRRLGLLGLAVLSVWPAPARAGGVVTNLTLSNFYGALLGGGQVVFKTNGTLTLTATIDQATATVLDASGQSVTLSGGGAVRLFTVRPEVKLTLLSLTLANGKSTNGGAIYNDGGVVIATNCTFYGNRAVGAAGTNGVAGADDTGIGRDGGGGTAGGSAAGGAVYNLGTLQLCRCALLANSASGGAGGNGGNGGAGGFSGGAGGAGGRAGTGCGGAIFNQQSLLLSECSFASNSVMGGDGGAGGAAGSGPWQAGFLGNGQPGGSGAGGAVYNSGTVTLLGCLFVTNSATGGKAANAGTDASGEGAEGPAGGDGLGGAVDNERELGMANCTFYGNGVSGGAAGDGSPGALICGDGGNGGTGAGGGLFNLGTASLTNCTWQTNAAAGGAGGKGATGGWTVGQPGAAGAVRGGAVATGAGTLLLKNCLLANSASGGNGFGSMTDGGHNLSSDASCAFTAPGSMNEVDPKLGDLGDNGGYTLTVPLPPDSPAIDAGEDLPAISTDQRRVARPFGAHTDIGAFEYATTLLSGRIMWRANVPLAGVVVTLNSPTGDDLTTVTGADGRFVFTNVDQASYMLSPQTGGVGFNTNSYLFTVDSPAESLTNLDFLANPERIVSNLAPANQARRLTAIGVPGQLYQFAASTNLVTWELLGAETAADANGNFEYADADAQTIPRRFYRTVGQ